MANKELRGASRREFIKGAFAIGAAMGWGPTRIKDFIERGGGTAAALECGEKRVQNLVVIVGSGGAHGYMHSLFPHPDSFAGPTGNDRASSELAMHFMQDSASTGAMPSNFGGALLNTNNAGTSLPAMADTGVGAWAAGEKYKRVFGVSNQAFRGITSRDTRSQAIDMASYGSTTVPSNTTADKSKNFVVVNRQTPWIAKYGQGQYPKVITALDGGGINSFHVTSAHNHYIDFNKKWSMMAAAAAIQLARPTITPVIFAGEMSGDPGNQQQFYGVPGSNLPPGAPTQAIVADAAGMVDLFNSNSAKAGGTLASPRNAVLYEAYVKGMIGSNKAATLPTFVRGYKTTKLAANLVGLNLADKLAPTPADQLRYGFVGSNPQKMADLRDKLIVTAKALKLGLTAQTVLNYFNDDPHDSFTSSPSGAITNASASVFFSNIFNAFMDDLMGAPDPFCPNHLLGDNTVIAFIGDTPRTGLSRTGWNDPSFGGQNRVWIMSNGYLRSGFFGGDRPRFPGEGPTSNDHTARGPGEGGLWDPRTGDLIQFDNAGSIGLTGGKDQRFQYGEMSMAAVLYAVAGGDERRVNDFYTGPSMPAVYTPILLP